MLDGLHTPDHHFVFRRFAFFQASVAFYECSVVDGAFLRSDSRIGLWVVFQGLGRSDPGFNSRTMCNTTSSGGSDWRFIGRIMFGGVRANDIVESKVCRRRGLGRRVYLLAEAGTEPLESNAHAIY